MFSKIFCSIVRGVVCCLLCESCLVILLDSVFRDPLLHRLGAASLFVVVSRLLFLVSTLPVAFTRSTCQSSYLRCRAEKQDVEPGAVVANFSVHFVDLSTPVPNHYSTSLPWLVNAFCLHCHFRDPLPFFSFVLTLVRTTRSSVFLPLALLSRTLPVVDTGNARTPKSTALLLCACASRGLDLFLWRRWQKKPKQFFCAKSEKWSDLCVLSLEVLWMIRTSFSLPAAHPHSNVAAQTLVRTRSRLRPSAPSSLPAGLLLLLVLASSSSASSLLPCSRYTSARFRLQGATQLRFDPHPEVFGVRLSCASSGHRRTSWAPPCEPSMFQILTRDTLEIAGAYSSLSPGVLYSPCCHHHFTRGAVTIRLGIVVILSPNHSDDHAQIASSPVALSTSFPLTVS